MLCIPAFFAFIGKNYLRVFSAYKGALLHRKYYEFPAAIQENAPFYVIGPLDAADNVGKRLNPERYSFFQGTCASLFDGFLRHLELHRTFVRSRPLDVVIQCWEN